MDKWKVFAIMEYIRVLALSTTGQSVPFMVDPLVEDENMEMIFTAEITFDEILDWSLDSRQTTVYDKAKHIAMERVKEGNPQINFAFYELEIVETLIGDSVLELTVEATPRR
jgi:hypothetical protein